MVCVAKGYWHTPALRASVAMHWVTKGELWCFAQNAGMPEPDDLPSTPPVPPHHGWAAVPSLADDGLALDIVCLCADWCGTCREYEATFAELQRALPGHRYRWIDIEDEADLVGDIDVETFPTLMLAHAGRVLFAGPVLPRLGDAQRLVAVCIEGLADQAAPQTTHQASQKPSADQALAQAYAMLAEKLATGTV